MTSRTRFEPALSSSSSPSSSSSSSSSTPSPRRCSTAARETSHAVGRDGHRPLVNGGRYPGETSPLRHRLGILPGTGRHLIVLGQRHGPVTVDPRPGELHVRHSLPGTVGLVIPQQVLELLDHLALVLQMAHFLKDLLEEGIGHLGRRGLKRSSSCLHPPPVPVVLHTTAVRTLPGQALPGWTLPAEVGGCRRRRRRRRRCTIVGRRALGVQESVGLNAGPLPRLPTVPRVATAHWTLTAFTAGDHRRRLAQTSRWRLA